MLSRSEGKINDTRCTRGTRGCCGGKASGCDERTTALAISRGRGGPCRPAIWRNFQIEIDRAASASTGKGGELKVSTQIAACGITPCRASQVAIIGKRSRSARTKKRKHCGFIRWKSIGIESHAPAHDRWQADGGVRNGNAGLVQSKARESIRFWQGYETHACNPPFLSKCHYYTNVRRNDNVPIQNSRFSPRPCASLKLSSPPIYTILSISPSGLVIVTLYCE